MKTHRSPRIASPKVPLVALVDTSLLITEAIPVARGRHLILPFQPFQPLFQRSLREIGGSRNIDLDFTIPEMLAFILLAQI